MSANNNIEIEIKFALADWSKIETAVQTAGGELLHHNSFQRAVRFDTPSQSLRERGIFLRVRSGEKQIMTVKRKLVGADENYKEREELEIEISDTMLAEKMLETLGYTQKWVMEKYRTEYALDGAVVALDRLPFGNFMEIEGGKEEIEKVIIRLGLEKEERLTVTYWHLFDDYKKATGSTGEDIVFPV
ncbi:MAG: class IV adenylate cyclase [Candidatus Vogelbacteria bacterium]|nr:class IV adenylate cyclase [Candidatus Vogelbacteria bacterium]